MNAPSPDQQHGRFLLLRGPWHRSSRVATWLVFVFLVLCNLTGQHVLRVAENVAEMNEFGITDEVLEHGWPLTFVTRSYWEAEKDPIQANPFLVGYQVEKFSLGAFAINLLILPLATLLAGFAFELWRRSRKHLWQFHLRDLMAAMLVIGLMAAWFANRRHQYANEQKSLYLVRPNEIFSTGASRTLRESEGGITWIRGAVGDAPFEFLDRVVEIEVHGTQLPRVSAFAQLAVLRVVGPVSNRDLTTLAACRQLRWLDLSYARPKAAPALDLPAIGSLRGLCLDGANCRIQGLSQLQNLESLDLTFREPFAPELQTMEDLALLPNLRIVTLQCADLRGDRLEPLSRCPNLMCLNLVFCQLDDDSFRHLGKTPNLDQLNLSEVGIAINSLRHLASLERLRQLNLYGIRIPAADYAHFSNMTVR